MTASVSPLDVLLCALSVLLLMGFLVLSVSVLQSVLDGCALLIGLFMPSGCFVPMAFLGGVGIASLITVVLMLLTGGVVLVLLKLKNNYGQISPD